MSFNKLTELCRIRVIEYSHMHPHLSQHSNSIQERLEPLILFIGLEVGPVNWFWKDFHLVQVGELQ